MFLVSASLKKDHEAHICAAMKRVRKSFKATGSLAVATCVLAERRN